MSFRRKAMGELDRASPSEALAHRRSPLILIVEDVRSGGNVGSILRTADAFGITEVALAGYTPSPPHREILKTSLGAEAAVPWRSVTDLSDYLAGLRKRGYVAAALEQAHGSITLARAASTLPALTALVLGNEVRGVSDATLGLVDYAVEIPQYGVKHSLNVSVSAGIAMYALTHR